MPSEPRPTATPAARSLARGGAAGCRDDGGQRDALVGQVVDQALEPERRDLGKGEGVADGDLAGQPQDAGPLDDQVDGEGAELAAVVQVDVEPAAVPVGDGEDRVQVLDRPVVEALIDGVLLGDWGNNAWTRLRSGPAPG